MVGEGGFPNQEGSTKVSTEMSTIFLHDLANNCLRVRALESVGKHWKGLGVESKLETRNSLYKRKKYPIKDFIL